MKERIEAIRAAARTAIEKTANENEIEELRVKYLGKKGELTALLKQMGSLSPEERPAMGQLVNEAKQKLEALITEKKAEMKQKATEARLKAEAIDITMPAKEVKTGGIHPLNHVVNDMIDIFQSMGFDVVDGPEVETDHYNFECLNVPADHPARDMQDSFYITDNFLYALYAPAECTAPTRWTPPIRPFSTSLKVLWLIRALQCATLKACLSSLQGKFTARIQRCVSAPRSSRLQSRALRWTFPAASAAERAAAFARAQAG